MLNEPVDAPGAGPQENPLTEAQVVQIRSSLHEFFAKVFAKGFLENDEYFRAHVTPAQGVPLEAFIQAPQIQEITSEVDLIRHTILVSKVIYIHEDDTVRAIVKPEQNILILRDIPSSTSSDEIVDIFTRAGVAAQKAGGQEGLTSFIPIGVRAEISDTWFITFASEANARAALQAIQGVQFDNKRIQARLKTTTAVKPIYTGGRSQQSSPEMGLPGGGPGGLGGAGPSPTAQGGMYQPRGPPDFYSGPVSPEFAPSMIHGMPPPPMFFQAPYMGAPMVPAGMPYAAMQSPLSPYHPPHMMAMGPPLGGGAGGMGGVKGMPPGQWGSPTNQGQGQGMGGMNPGMVPMGGGPGMGQPLGGPRGPSKARRVQGQSAPYPYDPSAQGGQGQGQGQGQWAGPSKGFAPRGQHNNDGGYARAPNQRRGPGLSSHSSDAADQGGVSVGGGNGSGGEGNGRGGRPNRLRQTNSAGVMDDGPDHSSSFSPMGPGGHAQDGDGAMGRRQARDRDSDGMLASGSLDADDHLGAGVGALSSGEGEGADGSNERRGKKPSSSGGQSEGSPGLGGDGKAGQGAGQRRDPQRTQQPRDPTKQRQAPRRVAQPDFDLSADFPTLPGEGGGAGGAQVAGGGGGGTGEGSPSAAAAGAKPVFGYAAALRRGPGEGGAPTAAPGPSSSSSSAAPGAGAGAASAPSPVESDSSSRRGGTKTVEAGAGASSAPAPSSSSAPAVTAASAAAAAAASPQSKPAGRAPAWGQAAPQSNAPPAAADGGASRQADGGEDVPSVTFGNFGPTTAASRAGQNGASQSPPAPAPAAAPASVESAAAGLAKAAINGKAEASPAAAADKAPAAPVSAGAWGNSKRSFSEVVRTAK